MQLRKIIGSRPIIMTGASVLVIKDQSLLLQLRADNGLWALPGGSMELGETFEHVAERELLEETGLVAEDLELFDLFSGEEFYYQYPNGDEVYNVTAAYVCSNFTGALNDNSPEVKQLQFFHYDNIPKELSPPDKIVIHTYLSRLNR